MSRNEARRLMADLASCGELARELAALEHDAGAWHRCAAAAGYELTGGEVEELLAARGLEDEDLEKVAGGWEDGGSGGGSGGDDGTGSSGGTGGTGGSTGGGG